MLKNRDWIELLSLINTFDIRYLVVGGYAVMKYTEPRFTKDLDLWVATDGKNAHALYNALKDFGAPLAGLTEKDFSAPGYFYQMGRPPLRVDIMMSIPGVEFDDAWERRENLTIGNLIIPFISRQDLILAKEASGRPQDIIDVDNLKKGLDIKP